MSWVSVEQRLPGMSPKDEFVSENVLISDGENIGFGYMQFEGMYEDMVGRIQKVEAEWVEQSNELSKGFHRKPVVKYWMNLPEMPKKRKKK